MHTYLTFLWFSLVLVVTSFSPFNLLKSLFFFFFPDFSLFFLIRANMIDLRAEEPDLIQPVALRLFLLGCCLPLQSPFLLQQDRWPSIKPGVCVCSWKWVWKKCIDQKHVPVYHVHSKEMFYLMSYEKDKPSGGG